MHQEFDVPVDAGHVNQFARAIGLPLPRSSVPPTFVVVADHHDPAFDRRPTPGQPWIGSGRDPSGVPDGDPAHHSLFHVEQRFVFARPVRIGEALRARRMPARTWTKQGRSAGRLDFVERVTELSDSEGELVVTNIWLDVATERTHASVTAGQTHDTPAVAPNPPGGTPVVENITRTQIVMYAGASGDFHPLHHDDVYARHRGYPGSFVPGMLTMAFAGRALADVIDTDDWAEFSGRFHAQVWPGDSLFAEVTVSPPDERPSAATVLLRTQRSVTVFTGSVSRRAI